MTFEEEMRWLEQSITRLKANNAAALVRLFGWDSKRAERFVNGLSEDKTEELKPPTGYCLDCGHPIDDHQMDTNHVCTKAGCPCRRARVE